MAHSDDEGLVLPPKVAPHVVAIVPIFRGDEERKTVREFIDKLVAQLVRRGQVRAAARVGATASRASPAIRSPHQQIVVDWRDNRPGDKQYHWEQRGVPFRIEVGPRDVAGRRVRAEEAARSQQGDGAGRRRVAAVARATGSIRCSATARASARAFRDANTKRADSYDELKQIVTTEGGFVRCFFKPGSRQRGQDQGRDQGDGALHSARPVGAVGALHLHRRADRYRSAVRGRVLMRGLAIVALAAALLVGCAGEEAARRVRIVGVKPPASCPVVDARLRGRGDNVTAAMRDLRRRAARSGSTDVVVTDGPRSDGNVQVVDAIGYACAGPTAP